MWNACWLRPFSVFFRLIALASAWLFAVKAARHGAGKHACPTRPTQSVTGFDVASPRAVEQPNRDVDAEVGKFRWAVFQPCWMLGDRSEERRVGKEGRS